nr:MULTISPECIES: diaminopimelate decarboxylase [unclassified Ochrobactrum]
MKNELFPQDTVCELAAQYATPLWIYNADVIRQQIERLAPFNIVRFAQKACSNVNILSLMREAGVHVDAVSHGEIRRAQQAGFPAGATHTGAAGIVFTADLLDRDTLDYVVQEKIEVNAGSLDMLHQLGERSPGHRVWLRINPGFGHGHSKKTNTGGENSKHGIWHAQLALAIALIKQYRLHLVGFHLHIGSGVDYRHLERVCQAMSDIISSVDHDFEAISAGGGLSVPYKNGDQDIDVAHYFNLWDQTRRHAEKKLGHPVRLEIEPGRFLVAQSAVLVAEVRATKQMGDNHFTLVDAGFNDLMRPALYGSYHHISVLSANSKTRKTEASRPTVIAGPLCESGDVFTQRQDGTVEMRELPPAHVGDYLVFHDAGAYGASMSSNYNSRPQAAEYLLDGPASRLIRTRQKITELYQRECPNLASLTTAKAI